MYANPAGAVLVFLSEPVPVKLHDDTTVFIDPDFLSRFANYQRWLRTLNERLRSNPRGTVGNGGGNTRQVVGVRLIARRGCGRVILTGRGEVSNLGDHVACILIGTVVIFQLEGVSGYQPPAVARGRYGHVAGLLLLHPYFSDRIALILGRVEPGVVKEFQVLTSGQLHHGGIVGQQAGRWSREIVVGHRVLAGAHFLAQVPRIDHLRVLESANLHVITYR